MSEAGNPMIILSVEDAEGNVTDSPLFVAVKVTSELCARLREASTLCSQHRLTSVNFRHEGDPPFWDESTPGGRINGFLTECVEWTLGGGCASLVLWGRLPVGDGGYSKVDRLAVSWVVDVEELEALREAAVEDEHPGIAVSYHEHWLADDTFEVEVLARVALMRQSGSDSPV